MFSNEIKQKAWIQMSFEERKYWNIGFLEFLPNHFSNAILMHTSKPHVAYSQKKNFFAKKNHHQSTFALVLKAPIIISVNTK